MAEQLDDEEIIPAALALLSQGLQMRGEEGDLDRALELGDRALKAWVPGARPVDHAEALFLYHDTNYWTGGYERAHELSRATRIVAADIRGAEMLLRGGAGEALALAGLGKHEEALRLSAEVLETARELGQNPRVVLNYSAIMFRELHDLDEARTRSAEALELSEGQSFGMPRRFASSDLLFTDLLGGDIGPAQAAWPDLWRDAEDATAWTKWLIYGRLAAARAEIALHAEGPDSAVEWAHKTIDITVRTRRRKYEARGRSILGEALARLGRRDEALTELQAAVAIADKLIGPPARWDARAALGRSAYALGEDEVAARAYGEAGELVRSFADTLAPERAERLLAAPTVEEILKPAAAG